MHRNKKVNVPRQTFAHDINSTDFLRPYVFSNYGHIFTFIIKHEIIVGLNMV